MKVKRYIAAFVAALALGAVAAPAAHAQVYPPYAGPIGYGNVMQPCGDDLRANADQLFYGYGHAYLHDYFRNNFGFSGVGYESVESHCIDGTTSYNVVWVADVWQRAACKFHGNTINYGISSQIVADTSWGTNGSGCSWY
jgi:hypothetical protein